MNDLLKPLDTVLDRRQILLGAGTGLVALGAGAFLAGCGGSGVSDGTGSGTNDKAILQAAMLAEALAVSMYTAIIASPVFTAIASEPDDQMYLTAARDEEMYHYLLLKQALGAADSQTSFWFPTGMFTNTQTTINTLVTLEEAFIAAYTIGAVQFSSAADRQLAAQIMGIECEHRVLARVIANDLSLSSTTGLSGVMESVMPANNDVYERTFSLHQISQVVTALTPFLSQSTGNSVMATFNPAYVPTTSGLQGNPPS